MIDSSMKLTAVVGYPLLQTLSPLVHNVFYERQGVRAVMQAFANENINEFIQAMRTLPIHLAAVTISHKETVMPLLDVVDAVAERVGAVNTVINIDGKLTGYNTDVVGVEKALERVKIKGKRAVVVGAGGAARRGRRLMW